MTNGLLIYIWWKICAFPHRLGTSLASSYMTLHPIPSEFPYIWLEFYFLLYQCTLYKYTPMPTPHLPYRWQAGIRKMQLDRWLERHSPPHPSANKWILFTMEAEGGVGWGGEGRGSCSGLMIAVALLCCGHTLPLHYSSGEPDLSVHFRDTRNYTRTGDGWLRW